MAMNNINVNLLFKANTQTAVNNINQLGQLLNQISTKTTIGINSGSIQQAVQAARELQIHLGNAVNVDTGRLDLSKFNASLKQSNTSLETLSRQLINSGATGQQAFAKLASGIAAAEKPALILGSTITSMMKTMGSAVMWSMAYNALNAITSAFTGAIDYAKDLNKALNNISIVSNLTTKQLADFSKTASKAAKELKSTTTEYAEAALIFYQQGLIGKAVEERANAVMKMAQVTGQTAETVSDQMTAIWNNFNDGSKSLEYYADVVNALGAATASSTDEIAQGLEKFAAVADTVGLSYEYATAALATVTAETRQSADVVGTAFKTLFARIQDLNLGKTLDDGTTLGSYSQALEKIGVQVLDSSGNLRKMDDILDDMASKWTQLSEAQQVATAQSVAGVRQYTQLIALMENWNSMEMNLDIAINAEGALDQQWEKWAESAEAAGKRVEESLNQLYSQILDDQLVIDFTNTIADLVGVIGTVIKSAGGIVPLLLMIAGLFSQQLIPIIMSFGQTAIYNFQVLIGAAEKERQKTLENVQALINEMQTRNALNDSILNEINLTSDLISVKKSVEEKSKYLSKYQREELQNRLAIYEALTNETKALNEQQGALEKTIATQKRGIVNSVKKGMNQTESELMTRQATLKKVVKGSRKQTPAQQELIEVENKLKQIKTIRDNLQQSKGNIFLKDDITTLENIANPQRIANMKDLNIAIKDNQATMDLSMENLTSIIAKRQELASIEQQSTAIEKQLDYAIKDQNLTAEQQQAIINESKTKLMEFAKTAGYSSNEIQELESELANLSNKDVKSQIDILKNKFYELTSSTQDSGDGLSILSQKIIELMGEFASSEEIDDFIISLEKSGNLTEEIKLKLEELKRQKQETEKAFGNNAKMVQGLTALGSALSQAAMGISAFMMLKDALDFEQEMDPMQRFYTIIMALGMAFPMLAKGIGFVTSGLEKLIKRQFTSTATMAANTVAQEKNNSAKAKGVIVGQAEVVTDGEDAISTAAVAGATQAQAGAQERVNTEKGINIASTGPKVAADAAETTGIEAQNSALRENARLRQQTNSGTGNPSGGTGNPSGGKKGSGGSGIGGAIAVIAAIAAVVIAIKLLVDHADKLRNKVKQAAAAANEAAEKANKNFEIINNKYNELISNIKDYQEGLDAIHKLTVGTQEFRDAISESNEKALELINTYKGLEYTWQGDLIVIDDASMDQLIQEQANARATALAQKYSANAIKRDTELEVDQETLARDTLVSQNQAGTKEDIAAGSNGAAVGAGIGGAIGGVAATAGTIAATGGPVGWIVGAAIVVVAAIGGLIGYFVSDNAEKESTDSEQKALDILAHAYYTQGDKALDPEKWEDILRKNGINDTVLIDSLITNSKAVQQNTLAVAQANQIARLELENLARENLAIADPLWNSRSNLYKDVAIQLAAKEVEEWDTDISQTQLYANGLIFGDFRTTYTGERIIKDYVANNEAFKEEHGGKAEFKQFQFNGADATGYNIVIYDSQGKEQNVHVSYAEMEAWEEGRLKNQALKSVPATSGVIERVNSIQSSEHGEALMSLMAYGDLSNLNNEEFEEFRKAWADGSNTILSSLQIQDILTKDFVDAAINARLENADKLLAKYQKRIQTEIDGMYQSVAEETGVDTLALEMYTDEIYSRMDLSVDEWDNADKKKTAAEAAIDLTRINKSIKESNEVLEENMTVLENWNEDSIATYEAAAQLSKALSGLFAGIEVSAKFINDNLGTIKKALKGDLESLETLKELASFDKIESLDFEENFELDFKKVISALGELETEFGEIASWDALEIPGLDMTAFLRDLNEMVQLGKITEAEIQSIFANMGYTPKVRMMKVITQNTSFSQRNLTYPGDPSKDEVVYEEIVTYSESTIPYYGDGEPEFVSQSHSDTYTTSGQTGADKAKLFTNAKADGKGYNAATNSILVGWANPYEDEDYGLQDSGALNEFGLDEDALDTGIRESGNEKNLEDEVKRYENITFAIEAQERALDKLNKQKDRAYGANRVKFMEEEIAAQEQLLSLEQEKLHQIEENYKIDYGYAKGLGLEVDENGVILNAEEVRASLVEQYNSGAISEEYYDEATKALNRFIDTNSEYYDQIERIEDKYYEIKDLELEKILYEVEFKVELNDRDIKFLDHMLENLDDDIYGIADSFDLIGQKADNTLQKIEHTTQGIRGILEQAGATEEQINAFLAGDSSALEDLQLEQGQVKALMEKSDELMSYSKELKGYGEEINEKFTGALDKANEAIQENASQLEHYNSVLTTYKDIIDLAGRKTLGFSKAMMDGLSDTIMKNAINQTEVAKASYEMNKAAADNARKLYEQGAITKEAYVQAVESEREAYENMLSALNEGVQIAADNFASAMERVAESFSEAVSGTAGSLENLQTRFDEQSTLNELYVEDYAKIYNLSKLTRDINKSINATDNIGAKRKLRELEEEIVEIQENGKQMSQYELDNLQRKYDLRLAEIALEEAQNAKNQVRMQRDSEGNWNYVYTADASKVDSAQQDYENALYNAQSANGKYIKEMQSGLISVQTAFQQSYIALETEAREMDMTTEEFNKRKKELEDYYLAQMDYYSGQLGIVINNNNALYETDWKNYSKATGYKISTDKDFIDNFNETTYAQLTGYKSIEEAQKVFAEQTEYALLQATDNFIKYKNSVESVFQAAGMSTYNFSNDFQREMKEIEDASDEVAENTEQMKDDMIDAFGQITSSVSTFNTNYGLEIDDVIQKNNELIESMNKVIKRAGEMAGIVEEAEKIIASDIESTEIKVNEHGGKTYLDGDYEPVDPFSFTYSILSGVEKDAKVEKTNTINLEETENESLTFGGNKDSNAYVFEYTLNDKAYKEYISQEDAYKLNKYGVEGYGDLKIKGTNGKWLGFYGNELQGATITARDSFTGRGYDSIVLTTQSGEQYDLDTSYWSHPGASDAYKEQNSDKYKYSEDLMSKMGISQNDFILKESVKSIVPIRDLEGNILYYGLTQNSADPYEEGNQISIQEYKSKSDQYRIFSQGPGEDPYEHGDKYVVIDVPNDAKGITNYWHKDSTMTKRKSTITIPKGKYYARYDKVNGSTYFLLSTGKNNPSQGWMRSENGEAWIKLSEVSKDTNLLYDTYMYRHWPDYLKKWYGGSGDNTSGGGIYYDENFYKFDTGGYTGEWDSSGRIAMLHQKEIVLNAHDTENFLSAINILRDIVSVIDLKAISQSMNLSNNISSSTVSPFTQTLEQEVTIHAEFPNATNRTEIEEAFDSLLNRASQYANRKY